jgi:branched-chain amino acid transport system permease protein
VVEYFHSLANYVANGLIMGCLYALMAVGLALILGVLKIVNFAHGEFYMMGAYVFYLLTSRAGLGPVPSILVSMVAIFVLGMLVERGLLTPLYQGRLERPDEFALLMTFGLSIFLVQLALRVFGPYQKSPPELLSGSFQLRFLVLPASRVVAGAAALVILFALFGVLQKTTLGIALRALAQDREVAAVMGIDVHKMSPVAFGMGTALAAASGSLLGPVFLVYPAMGLTPAIKSYVILVLGGMGSIKGAVLGAILLGLLESLGVFFLSPGYRDAYGFAVLILVLLLRPSGLFGGEQL